MARMAHYEWYDRTDYWTAVSDAPLDDEHITLAYNWAVRQGGKAHVFVCAGWDLSFDMSPSRPLKEWLGG
jgi:hypothetical protein